MSVKFTIAKDGIREQERALLDFVKERQPEDESRLLSYFSFLSEVRK